MAENREPARYWYDVHLSLNPETPGPNGQAIHGLVKFTYQVDGQRLEYAAAESLADPIPGEEIPIPPGSDFWPQKAFTDVVVQGSAFAAGANPVPEVEVRLEVGEVERRIVVFGDRDILFQASGTPRIGPPEPFEEMALTWENAYGGLDDRTPVPEPTSIVELMRLKHDHPGLYPRNPFGKGYLVEPGPLGGATMPNLEDPLDRLTTERIVTRDPRRWYRQPIPACFDFMPVGCFPRKVFMDPQSEPWHPAPDDASLPEVERGFMWAGYRARMREARSTPDPLFFQGGSHGLILGRLDPGTPVQVSGMHPEHPVIRFLTPEAPVLRLWGDGQILEASSRLHHMVVRPEDLTVTTVYGVTGRSPRGFIPGIHKHIPIYLQVGDDEAVPFPTPPTLREQKAQVAREREEEKTVEEEAQGENQG